MSTNRSIDVTVKTRFPHPVAAAWRRAFVTTSDADRIKHLLACFDILLRTLGSYFVHPSADERSVVLRPIANPVPRS